MGGEADNDRYRAPALDKGLDILELLASIDGGLTQAEIAKALGRSPNENYRMLDRLVRRGYVVRNDAERFELTLKLFGLAHLHRPIRRLVSQATPLMRDLAARIQQANHLAVYDRSGVTVIAQTDAPGMPPWRKRLFIAMARNSSSPIEHFGLPWDRTVTSGSQVGL